MKQFLQSFFFACFNFEIDPRGKKKHGIVWVPVSQKKDDDPPIVSHTMMPLGVGYDLYYYKWLQYTNIIFSCSFCIIFRSHFFCLQMFLFCTTGTSFSTIAKVSKFCFGVCYISVFIQRRLGILGFSAGGHLATVAATSFEKRPAFQILIYATTDVDAGIDLLGAG